MLKIGDFSKLAQVTVKTLRHYGQLGLLKPAWIDRYTGYRYYSLEQLPRLNRILALKDLGFTLEQIALLLDEDLSAEQLRGIVLSKRVELEQRVREEQVRLARVEARLKQIEQEGKLPRYEVVLKKVAPQRIACARSIVPAYDLIEVHHALLRKEISAWFETSGARAGGPWMLIYDNPEYFEHNISIQVARALEGRRGVRAQGSVSVQDLPGLETAATVAHANRREDQYQAYSAVYAWAEANRYRVVGPLRELLLDEDAASEGGMLESQFPVEPASLPRLWQASGDMLKENSMEPTFVRKPAFLVAGTLYQGKNENQEISQMWSRELLPRIHEIKRVDPYVSFGVCQMLEGLPEGAFQYLAGCEVTGSQDVPEGMVMVEVPEQDYAVFAHRGSLAGLSETNRYIYGTWLPKSGYRRGAGPDLEVYTSEFHGFEDDSVLYLYVPVEK